MNRIDQAILEGSLTLDMVEAALEDPLPPVGYSYWGDCMRETDGDVLRSVRMAAVQMGSALTSLTRVTP